MLIMLTVVSGLNLSRTQVSRQLKQYLGLFSILLYSVLELLFLFLNSSSLTITFNHFKHVKYSTNLPDYFSI